MNVEQIKMEWTRYNEKLALSQQLSDKLIISMLKERSRSRISAIRRSNSLYLLLMCLVLTLLIAILTGNPFDFDYSWQFIPYGVLVIGVVITIITLIQSIQSLPADLNKSDLSSFLKQTVLAYDRKKKIESWFGIIMFTGGLLTVFSFLPGKLKNKGLTEALLETGLMVVITIIIYFIAFKAGAFKNHNKAAFENDLKELNNLKQLSSEFQE
jgi:MFS family permease